MENNVTFVKVTKERGKEFFRKLGERKQEKLKELEDYAKKYIWTEAK